MKQNQNLSADQLTEFHRSHKIFGLRTKKELKRAERYCEFLSLLVVDIASLSKFAQRKDGTGQSSEKIQDALENVIRKSVRETDIVSKFENNLLALLLPETPKEGANCLSGRLKEGTRAFASSLIKLPQNWEAPVEMVSFPDKDNGRERFLSFAKKFELI